MPAPLPNRDISLLAARILLALLYLLSGLSKVTAFDGAVQYAASHNLPLPQVGIVIAILVELPLAILLILGWQTRLLAWVFAIYTVATALFFHNFWDVADAAQHGNQFIHFWKNIAITGGYLALAGAGSGRIAIRPD
ncbi:inner membrane protein YphA [Silvimonas iriomotensis]|uniref:Inner membrane protein YphA n=1 Tax=Silvimonas iriomotensis TaxID=449662 RepID=A0ABQ2P8D7_9NEIS|nr:inner membrane protein YphA [Silvimonas iriomotensis]